MIRSTIMFAFLLCAISVWGQAEKREVKNWGVIPSDHILMTEYSEDKQAEAVVLLDEGEASFIETQGAINCLFKRRKRIKILKEAGLSYAEIEIPYYYDGDILEEVSKIEAITYNTDGKLLNKTVLKKEDIFDEKTSKYRKAKKFVFPNTKVGSVLEFRYELLSPSVYNLPDWEFQTQIPTVYSFYKTRMIPFYEYRYIIQGIAKLDHHKSYEARGFENTMFNVSYKEMVYEFAMYDQPAFRDQSYITSIKDYIAKLDFQLSKINYPDGQIKEVMSSWEKINDDMLKSDSFGRLVKKLRKRADKFIDIESMMKLNENDRYNAVVDYVKNTYTWNGYSGIYGEGNVGEYSKKKELNNCDINLLTCALLNAVEIETHPIISSTRGHGKIKRDYAFSHFFNYVLFYATVNGQQVLGDATAYFYPNNRIPKRAINSFGLIIREDNSAWIDLYQSPKSFDRSNFQCKLDKEGVLHTKVRTTLKEHEAADFREHLKENEHYIIDLIKKTSYDFEEESIRYDGLNEKDKRFVYQYEVSSHPEQMNDKIFITPFLGKPIQNNPFKEQTRNYPIDMIMPKVDFYFYELTIPDNYKVSYTPEDYKIENNLFQCNYNSTQIGNKLLLNYTYTFRKAVYEPAEYKQVVSFFKTLARLSNEKIVLTPIPKG